MDLGLAEIVDKISVRRDKNLNDAVLGEIREIATENGISREVVLDERAIVNALVKATPTKPYPHDLWELGTVKGYTCPYCGYDYPINYTDPYCSKCGQCIDRSN